MFQEGDQVSLRREARITHPAGRLVQRLAGRELQAVPSRHFMDNGQTRAAGGPVGLLNVSHDLAGSATHHRDLRKGAATKVVGEKLSLYENGHFSRRRDSKKLRVFQS